MSLYVDETGTPGAPSIIFLHGVGASGWMWQPQVSAFADFHCLNIDLPGHGKSRREDWISLSDTSSQIATIIRTRTPQGRAHVVGLSLGGHVALVLLEQYAVVLERVVISGVTAAPMPNRALLPVQLWLMSGLLKRRWFVKAQARSLQLSTDMQSAFINNMLAMSMQAYRRIWQEAVHYHAPDSLRTAITPTLITAGSRESKVITQAVVAISNLMPNAQGRFAPGLGHGWNIEDPDLFNTMIRAWITGSPLPHRLKTAHNGDSTGR